MFAMDNWGVVPDILTTAIGITNAAVPLGLCATTQRIASCFDDRFFSHGHTYEAHPLMLAPAIASINEMKRLDLVHRAAEMGAYLGEKLTQLTSRHPSIGDVRGLGMFWGVDMVKNRKTKAPFNTAEEKIAAKPLLVDRIASQMMSKGVYISSWISHFVIAPPLIIEKSEIDFAVSVFDEALQLADQEVQN
jgi:taurine--2-oxoglutarate transaminase